MRLSRKQSLVLSVAVIVAFFVGTSLLSRTKTVQAPKQTVFKQSLSEKISKKAEQAIAKIPKPTTKLIMGEFHRSETKDGKMIWEITSKEGRYDPKTQKARLQEAFLRFYQKNGDIITVNTKRAEVKIQDGKLSNVKLVGNVIVTLNDITLVTERASMENNNQTVVVPSRVIIKKKGLRLEGEKLKANLETKEFELIKNVSTKIDIATLKEVKKNINQRQAEEANAKQVKKSKKKNKKQNKKNKKNEGR